MMSSFHQLFFTCYIWFARPYSVENLPNVMQNFSEIFWVKSIFVWTFGSVLSAECWIVCMIEKYSGICNYEPTKGSNQFLEADGLKSPVRPFDRSCKWISCYSWINLAMDTTSPWPKIKAGSLGCRGSTRRLHTSSWNNSEKMND